MAYHKPRTSSLSPPETSITPYALSSSPLPMNRGLSQGGSGSAPPKVLTCYKHVTGRAVPGRAEGVGAVPFLQNQYRVTHVAVNKVDTKVGARRHPPLASPHYKTNETGRYRVGDPIQTGVRCVRWCLPLRGALLTFLGLFMVCQ